MQSGGAEIVFDIRLAATLEAQKPLGYLYAWAIIPPHTLRVLL
jgi:hypothetical protein